MPLDGNANATNCFGEGRTAIRQAAALKLDPGPSRQTRLEILIDEDAYVSMGEFLRQEISPEAPMTVCVESVEVLRKDHFAVVGEPAAI